MENEELWDATEGTISENILQHAFTPSTAPPGLCLDRNGGTEKKLKVWTSDPDSSVSQHKVKEMQFTPVLSKPFAKGWLNENVFR